MHDVHYRSWRFGHHPLIARQLNEFHLILFKRHADFSNKNLKIVREFVLHFKIGIGLGFSFLNLFKTQLESLEVCLVSVGWQERTVRNFISDDTWCDNFRVCVFVLLVSVAHH